MNVLTKKSLVVALGFSAALIAGAAFAGGDPPVCPAGGTCPPPRLICHNIGGPDDKGANCEATGTCVAFDDEGDAIVFTNTNQYLGIVIGAGDNSRDAHLRHGDGYVDLLFDPPLHLASVNGPHLNSNVECLATRATTTQPDEPGN